MDGCVQPCHSTSPSHQRSCTYQLNPSRKPAEIFWRKTLNVKAYINRGVAYRILGQYERAIQDYDEAIGVDPQYEAAYNNRGMAYWRLGQHERAIQDYDEAIRLNPQDADAYAGRGIAYRLIGKSIEAERDFAKAKELGIEAP